MTDRILPRAILAKAWAGRARNCPQCKTEFVSNRNRGHCPNCRHVSFAFDEYGPPPGLDIDAFLDEEKNVPDEISRLVMTWLKEKASKLPERPTAFSDPRLSEVLQHEREMWDYERHLMQDAIDSGGELWLWSSADESIDAGELMACRCGYAVVRDGRVQAVVQTAMS